MHIQQPKYPPSSTWRPPILKDLPRWEGQSRVGLDIETCDPLLTKLGPGPRRDGRIIGISFCFDSTRRPYYLPIDHASGGNLPAQHVWSYLKDQAKVFRGEIVGANLQYDLDFLEEAGLTWRPEVRFRDVQLADPLIYELHMSYSLENIAKRWEIPAKDEGRLRDAAARYGLGNHKKDMWKLPAQFVGEYAEHDALLPLQILELQEKELASQGLERVWDLETDCLPIALSMRRLGVRIDWAKLQEIDDWASGIERSEMDKVRALTGVEVGFGDTSKSALLAKCLESIGLEVPITPSTQKPSVKADFLRANPHDVTNAILRAKQFAKLRTTFCKQVWAQRIGDRVHCTFNQLRTQKPGQEESMGAAFGRWSSSDFNIQNQPIRNPEYGQMWRSIFIPDEGKEWCCCDFSAQEPRLTVHFAALNGLPGAQAMADRYCSDPTIDPHAATAAMMFEEWGSLEEGSAEYKAKREQGKTLFLSWVYGKGAGKIARELGYATEWKEFTSRRTGDVVRYEAPGPEGQKFIDKFNARVPFVKILSDALKKMARERGYVQTMSGRRCRFRMFGGERIETHKALNRVVQGSAGCQIKMAMVDLWKAGIKPQITVHDDCSKSCETEEEMREMGRIMRDAVTLRVPSKLDVEHGNNWGNLKNRVEIG